VALYHALLQAKTNGLPHWQTIANYSGAFWKFLSNFYNFADVKTTPVL